MPNRGKDKPPNQTMGTWSWNTASFQAKYQEQSELACWIWQGSAGPNGALFGAYRNQQAQMTQARRIAWMQHTNQPVDLLQIKMTCRNKMCVNPHHMISLPNNRIRHD